MTGLPGPAGEPLTELHPLLEGKPLRHELLRVVHAHRAGGICVADLTAVLGMARGGPLTHLRVLEDAGLLRRVRQSDGRRLVSLTADGAGQVPLLPPAVPARARIDGLHPVLARYAMTRRVLAEVAASPGFLAGELGHRLGIATASTHLLRLAQAGLIVRPQRDGVRPNRVTDEGEAQLRLLAQAAAGAR